MLLIIAKMPIIQIGLSTHNHDHCIKPIIFKTIKIIANTSKIPILPPPSFYLLFSSFVFSTSSIITSVSNFNNHSSIVSLRIL